MIAGMTTTDPMDLLKRIIDAYDTFTAAEIDLKAHEIEPFRAALAGRIREADELTGRRRERGLITLKDPPQRGGWY
jgi:hypothetical protein